MESLIPVEVIERKIFIIRRKKVMLDADLADLYGVETRSLVQAVKRNYDRFPPDFMFQLTQEEYEALRSQFVISKGKGGRRYFPYAFTEQGVAMLSGVLNSQRAIQVNITIMRVFSGFAKRWHPKKPWLISWPNWKNAFRITMNKLKIFSKLFGNS